MAPFAFVSGWRELWSPSGVWNTLEKDSCVLHVSGIFTVTSLFQILGRYFSMLIYAHLCQFLLAFAVGGGAAPPRTPLHFRGGAAAPPHPPFGGIRREKSVQFAGIRRQIAPPESAEIATSLLK